ncbi:hypothetical protein AMIS_67220 [Actinoplanes missouriensis 431]|uniref:Helix-turn-helix domain-containing protein n=1 Tax=Actinoplanes missouriensis (strain ATCC 14538 / DSM 43046 / CBS 188.64 / JCM 3121 / NBRC 102363 / NCIMB 12654 / NRRL B-3342 / UNCC 431) TaxID=512565 RepID=I0HG05_ACTM4|nr:excisionase family DNA-binding protein [Actinoplanes missouriensis]BAL91942.1 hypothetical protein AMIS_67220 [Actinoplanes missouriensis 431]
MARIAGAGTVADVNEERISVKQAAGLLGVSKYVVYRMIDEGILPAYRPSPRRTWLRREEVLSAIEVPVKPKPKFPVVPPEVEGLPASGRPEVLARRTAKEPPANLSGLKGNAAAYAHLLR